MRAYDARDIAIKLVGVYIGLKPFSFIPTILVTSGLSAFVRGTEGSFFIVYLLTMFLIAAIFIFCTDFIQKLIWTVDKSGEPPTPDTGSPIPLSFFLALMGFYFAVMSSVVIVSSGLQLLLIRDQPGSIFHSPYLLAQAFQCIIGLIFIFRAKQIEKFINTSHPSSPKL